jgi:hypothetical protein
MDGWLSKVTAREGERKGEGVTRLDVQICIVTSLDQSYMQLF